MSQFNTSVSVRSIARPLGKLKKGKINTKGLKNFQKPTISSILKTDDLSVLLERGTLRFDNLHQSTPKKVAKKKIKRKRKTTPLHKTKSKPALKIAKTLQNPSIKTPLKPNLEEGHARMGGSITSRATEDTPFNHERMGGLFDETQPDHERMGGTTTPRPAQSDQISKFSMGGWQIFSNFRS